MGWSLGRTGQPTAMAAICCYGKGPLGKANGLSPTQAFFFSLAGEVVIDRPMPHFPSRRVFCCQQATCGCQAASFCTLFLGNMVSWWFLKVGGTPKSSNSRHFFHWEPNPQWCFGAPQFMEKDLTLPASCPSRSWRSRKSSEMSWEVPAARCSRHMDGCFLHGEPLSFYSYFFLGG